MIKSIAAILVALHLPLAAVAENHQAYYRWVDSDGVVHYGDSVPAEYAEVEKQIVNDAGVTVDVMRGKKTEEEIAEEKRMARLAADMELQRRADAALLATYLSVDEIVMHRDRRVQLFQAQARVTELYLKNLERRLQTLQELAAGYRPYSSDPDAEMIAPDLAAEISETKDMIARHEMNLQRFRSDQQQIVARFDGDINRFKTLKGID
jgi:hypothetical protein